jgi:hypothetical protein
MSIWVSRLAGQGSDWWGSNQLKENSMGKRMNTKRKGSTFRKLDKKRADAYKALERMTRTAEKRADEILYAENHGITDYWRED